MIALWMFHALVVSTLIAAVAWCLEQVARLNRWPTRVIWIGAAAAMIIGGLTTAGALMRDQVGAAAILVEQTDVTAIAGGDIVSRSASALAKASVAWDSMSATTMADVRTIADDRTLLTAWALLSAFLAGVVLHAALEGQRLRHGLEEREIEGTPVLLSDTLGPSALGVLSPGILLPRWALELDESLLTLILRHEREHLAARDPALLLTALMSVVLVPWNLPLWWTWKRLRLAIEVDCDSRVLQAHPDVRRYAGLLLLTGQRAVRAPWASRPVITAVAPLQPRVSHLNARIRTMTQLRTARSMIRATLLGAVAAVTATVAFALPSPRTSMAVPPDAARAVVHLTNIGVMNGETAGDSVANMLLVYGTGDVRLGIAGNEPVALTDTLRLNNFPAMTADVTDGEVHLVWRGKGLISVGGEVSGGPATHVAATGRHIVLLKGGAGIRPTP